MDIPAKANTKCHQFLIREKLFESDLIEFELTKEQQCNLKVKDFEFKNVPQLDKQTWVLCRKFIEKYEWLQCLHQRNTHLFVSTYRNKIAGVIYMSTPNAFSNILGPSTKDMEKLISRGACAAFTPKNLGSALISFAINWMANNTPFRIFGGYSDKEAGELGTIYQACGFIYLGDNYGGNIQIKDPNHPEKGWFSDRESRKISYYKRYAAELSITWDKAWSIKDKMLWDKIPTDISAALKNASKNFVAKCDKRYPPSKHKYIKILGPTKKETKKLNELFLQYNPTLNHHTVDGRLIGLPYPKTRGQ